MIRYYHKTRFLGYGVGINPLSGSIVLVTDDNEYRAYRRDQITHHVVGSDILDERTKHICEGEFGNSKIDNKHRA